MSAYRKRWVEVLENQQIPGWEIDVHGQAIVIKVPSNENTESIEKQFSDIITALSPNVTLQLEWLKFIFYNEKVLFTFIMNPDHRI